MSRTRALRRNRRTTSVGPVAALTTLTAIIDNLAAVASTTFDVYLSTSEPMVDTAAALAGWRVWMTVDGVNWTLESLAGTPAVSVVGNETRVSCEVTAVAAPGFPVVLLIPVTGSGLEGYGAQRLVGMSSPEIAAAACAVAHLTGP